MVSSPESSSSRQVVSPDTISSSSSRRRDRGDEATDEDTTEQQEALKRMRLLHPSINGDLPTLLRDISSNKEEDVQYSLSKLSTALEKEQNNEGTTVTFCQHGGPVIVINAMTKHQTCLKSQTNSCKVMSWLCYDRKLDLDHLGGMEGIRLSFGSLGALECLKRAIEQFPKEEFLNLLVMGAFYNLLILCQKNMPLLLGFEGFFTMLVGIMRQFPHNEKIQTFGCQIMRSSFRKVNDNKKVFKEAGALSVVGLVMERFTDDSEAYIAACEFMAKYTEKTEPKPEQG